MNVLHMAIQLDYSYFVKSIQPLNTCGFLAHSLILFKILGYEGGVLEGDGNSYITFNFRMKFPAAEYKLTLLLFKCLGGL